MAFEKITERTGLYRHLAKMSIAELLVNINKEDQNVPDAVSSSNSPDRKIVGSVSDKLPNGRRLFYMAQAPVRLG